MVLSGKERLAIQHLSKDATGTPYIHLNIILLPRQHNFGSPVISRGDIASHLRILDTCKAKIANLQIAIFVDKDVTGLQVTVDHACRVYVLESALWVRKRLVRFTEP
jgi:hypothetical protein